MHTMVPIDHGLTERLLDALPTPVFLADDELRILAFNDAAAAFLETSGPSPLAQLCGHVLRCLNHDAPDRYCGQTEACKQCHIRGAASSAWEHAKTTRRRHEFQRHTPDGGTETVHLRVTATPLELDGRPHMVLVLEDVSDITRLHRILPICASCKKVRDTRDAWHEVEVYVTEHTDVQFSHGLCEECAPRYFAVLPPAVS